ncbi:MAG TPA: hypothetical protein VFU12_03045 [Glycomyces sp.]|nr:hypothetical protein [Glycomyces sp.]
MPDPTPEQPPSWPPASEPAATPTNPPRITARGVGHLPSVQPEDEDQGAVSPSPEPAPVPGDFADLTAEPPLPNRTPEVPPPPAPEPEMPPRQKWGEPPDMSGEWPPRENQDWISQQARTGGWGSTPGGGAAWPDPTQQPPADQSYAPGPESVPHQGGARAPEQAFAPSPQAAPVPTEGRGSDAFASPPPPGTYQGGAHGGPQGGVQSDPFRAEAPQAPQAAQAPPVPPPAPASQATQTAAPERPAEPAAEEPAPRPSKPSPPPTHAGVRYAIYGIGGIITLGLIIAIVVMLGGPPSSEPSEGGSGEEDTSSGEGAATEGALDADRYAELAAAAGTDAWFEYRHGAAGENAAGEEVPGVGGDAVTAEPLFGDADRSIQGQLAYVTEDADLSGVDHVSVLEADDTLLGITPRAGGRFSEEGVPELELVEGSTADCVAGLGGLGAPVALARPEQSGEIDAHSVIVFANGVLATAGISGAQGGTCLQLPEGQVPTDVALTDGNELALVTTWSPETQTGALVVVALADKAGSYNSSWSESYPGLPNPGHFGAAEVVGQVELPVTAPTSVDAWSDSSGSMTTGRTTVEETSPAGTVATAAHAVVGSLSESQVVTVDLTGVLTGLAAQHVEGAEFAFDAAASEPAVFEGGVADVAVNGDAFAVATGDGAVHELDAELTETAVVEVGPNPTCLVVGAQSGQFIATTRGDSGVSWVSGGEVVKELADSRLTDAVCASETPALDVQGYAGNATVLLVSDFEGQALHTYLVDEATLPGGAAIGGDGFAYGGAYTVQGKPFDASVTLDLE